MSEYMLLLRGGDTPEQDLSPAEMQAAIKQFSDWARQLEQEHCLIAAEKLSHSGHVLKKQASRVQIDGPFTETKETIGGFFIITADNYDHATTIAQQCPIFDEGGHIEIREIQR